MLTYSWIISDRTYCVIIFKKLNYHVMYGFALLTILSSYGPVTLDHFISFTQNYKRRKNIKSKIKFEIHLFNNEVHFLDVKHGKLRTTLFTKSTDSRFCLNASSCHPSNVPKIYSKDSFFIGTYIFSKIKQ